METQVSFMQQILLEQFGLEELRPRQKEIIDCLLAGEHTLALLPTGYGKSLCYQLTSQMLPGLTLVISPLIALMQDQVSGLHRRGIRNATVLNSTLSFAQISERLNGIKNGAYKLVYVAPERFDSQRFRELLQSMQISLLVIDEAHCISQWGHDFRPQYRTLSDHLRRFTDTVVLALTATATPAVQKDIVSALGLPKMRIISGGFDRPNLRFEVKRLEGPKAKDAFISGAIKQSSEPAIVYTSSKKEAERLAQFLRHSDISAVPYHAGLGGEQRQNMQFQFEHDKVQVIVGTIAFGMGIDKPNIRRVIHNNLPASLEDYYQQAGRAGRDGQQATCTLIYQPRDIFIQKWLIKKNYPTTEQLNALLNLLKGATSSGVTANEILATIDFEDAPLNSALDHLRALNAVTLSNAGCYSLNPSVRPHEIDFDRLWQRRRRDELRLNHLVQYAEDKVCRRQAILKYFGEPLKAACSGCDICQPASFSISLAAAYDFSPPSKGKDEATRCEVGSTREGQRQESDSFSGGEIVQRSILRLAKQISGQMGRTSIAAILMGSKSKKILGRGLDKNPEYGRLKGYSEQKLLSCIDSLVACGFLKVSAGLYPKVFTTPSADQHLEAISE